jgi:hypothetical protein
MFRTIKFTDQGKTISGLYYVHSEQFRLVTAVTADGRQKTTQFGGSPPALRAAIANRDGERSRCVKTQAARGAWDGLPVSGSIHHLGEVQIRAHRVPRSLRLRLVLQAPSN